MSESLDKVLEDAVPTNKIMDALKEDLQDKDAKDDFNNGEPFYYILNNALAIAQMKGDTFSLSIVGARKLDVDAGIFKKEEPVRTFSIKDRFALKRTFAISFDKDMGEGERLYTYPEGSAFTIANYNSLPGHYNIVFDKDKRERPASPAYHIVSEQLLKELTTPDYE